MITVSPAIFKKIDSISTFEKEVEKKIKRPVTELLTVILGGGISLMVSDIHLEPKEKQASVRIRMDGILQNVLDLDSGSYQALLSRIKLMSKTKLNVSNRPQSGRFTASVNHHPIEVRVSILPTNYGESIVLRILNPKKLKELESLGLREELLKLFQGEIKKPNGMIIVTGPTGSGKTTTLYAFLMTIKKPAIKIITIEDPIEYHLAGITQTQTMPDRGYDFASGLKSIMRQDPDIILVGEIRDAQTSQIAVQAALTGHLVLTTLHSNDAPGTLARLISLQAKPENIGPAVNLVIAQRLVRKLCQKCKNAKNASPEEIKKIKSLIKGIPLKLIPKKNLKNWKIPKIKGCEYCNFTGYRGQIGIFEAFPVDAEIEKFILANPSVAALRKKVVKRGMLNMKQDGLLKVLEGITTLEELERVVGE